MGLQEGFTYELANGTLLRRSDVIEKIKEILSNVDYMICPELAEALTMTQKSVHQVLRYMVTMNILTTRKKQRWTQYILPCGSLLGDILHPEHKEILNHARHTQGTIHHLEDSKIISYPSNIYGHGHRAYFDIYQAIE